MGYKIKRNIFICKIAIFIYLYSAIKYNLNVNFSGKKCKNFLCSKTGLITK